MNTLFSLFNTLEVSSLYHQNRTDVRGGGKQLTIFVKIITVLIVAIGLAGLMFTGTSTAAQSPTPTPTPIPSPSAKWVPALFDDSPPECFTLNGAELSMNVVNTITGTIEISTFGHTGWQWHNGEYCRVLSDWSEIGEEYRVPQHMWNWSQPGVYGFRHTITSVTDPMDASFGSIGPTVASVPGYESWLLEPLDQKTICFQYGGLPPIDEDIINYDGQCDEMFILGGATTPIAWDPAYGVYFITAINGRTHTYNPLELTILNPQWLVVGDASNVCDMPVEIGWDFESPPMEGEWAAPGFSRTDLDSHTGGYSLLAESGGETITSTLTYDEALASVQAQYNGYSGPLFDAEVNVWVKGDVTVRVELEGGLFEDMVINSGEWGNFSLVVPGEFRALHLVVADGDNYVDDIQVSFLLPVCNVGSSPPVLDRMVLPAGAQCPLCSVSDAHHFSNGLIDTGNGNVSLHTVDLSLPIQGGTLAFERSYASGGVVRTRTGGRWGRA